MFSTTVFFLIVTSMLVSWNLKVMAENRHLTKHLRKGNGQ